MRDQLISFEVAKLAKEKGFNIHCEFRFNRYKNNKLEPSPGLKVKTDTTQIYAPTQSLLQKWLRESHNIHINCIYSTMQSIINKYGTGMYFWGIHEAPQLDQKVECFNNYEEALEVALFEALKLIK